MPTTQSAHSPRSPAAHTNAVVGWSARVCGCVHVQGLGGGGRVVVKGAWSKEEGVVAGMAVGHNLHVNMHTAQVLWHMQGCVQ